MHFWVKKCFFEEHLKKDIGQYLVSADKKMVDKESLVREMVRKWSIDPSLAQKMVDILLFMDDKDEITTEVLVQHFGFTATTTKRYLRQLVAYGYLIAHGGNRNRTYSLSR